MHCHAGLQAVCPIEAGAEQNRVKNQYQLSRSGNCFYGKRFFTILNSAVEPPEFDVQRCRRSRHPLK